jgi:hypothetical protein
MDFQKEDSSAAWITPQNNFSTEMQGTVMLSPEIWRGCLMRWTTLSVCCCGRCSWQCLDSTNANSGGQAGQAGITQPRY